MREIIRKMFQRQKISITFNIHRVYKDLKKKLVPDFSDELRNKTLIKDINFNFKVSWLHSKMQFSSQVFRVGFHQSIFSVGI